MSESASAPVRNTGGNDSALGGWPAYILVGIVLGAALFSFSPRPKPPFPATAIHADGMLVNGLAVSGSRFIAAGENGHILIADSATGPWSEASVGPQRGATLTQVKFVSDKVVIAVGHDGWILRSDDAGKTFKEAAFNIPAPSAPVAPVAAPAVAAPAADPAVPVDPASATAGSDPFADASASISVPSEYDPLFGIAGPYDGKLFAFGAFGQMLTSTDEGSSWQRVTHAALGDHHLYGMTQAADGSLVLVGERGLMLKSTDNGQNWHALPSVYTGSFFGAMSLPSKRLLAFGMRGNVFYSTDAGQTWKKSEVPEGISLYGGVVDADGSVVLVGDGCTILRSTDDGASFTVVSRGKRERLVAVIPLQGEWLTAGEGGIDIQKPNTGPASDGEVQ